MDVRLTRPSMIAFASLGNLTASISWSSSTQASTVPSGLRSRWMAPAITTPRALRWLALWWLTNAGLPRNVFQAASISGAGNSSWLSLQRLEMALLRT